MDNAITINNINFHKISHKSLNIKIFALLILNDSRLGISSSDGILIFPFHNNTLIEPDITIKPANTTNIFYITQLENSNLVSCNSHIISLWSLQKKSFTNLKNITCNPQYKILQVISLNYKNMFAYITDGEEPIHIHRGTWPYFHYKSLPNNSISKYAILKLKKANILVSGTYYENKLCFYNLDTYLCDKVFNDVQCIYRNGLYERECNHTVLVGGKHKLTIVEYINYQIVTVICFDDQNGILSICGLNDNKVLIGYQFGFMSVLDCCINMNDFKEMDKNDDVTAVIKINEGIIMIAYWSGEIILYRYS